MLAGKVVAQVSSKEFGCTSLAQAYDISLNSGDNIYRFWDTPGLNEGDDGNVPAGKAIESLRQLVEGLPTVNLVIYCVRAQRLTGIVQKNYETFCKIMGDRKVPMLLVLTGLEQEDDRKGWWKRNRKVVKRMRMTFEQHACVTTIKGTNGIYEKEYQVSTDVVWVLVKEHCKVYTGSEDKVGYS